MDEEETKVQPIVIVVEKSSNKVPLDKSYKSKAAIIIGTIHILCGVCACLSNIGLLVFVNRFHLGVFGTGIWSSVFFFISGGLSICSGKNTNSCLIISTMVMSIFSAISAGILVIFSGIGVAHDECYHYYCDMQPEIFHWIQLLAGMTEIILAITSASFSCKATCCRDKLDTSTPYKVVYKPDGDIDHDKIVSLALSIGNMEQEIGGEEQEEEGKSFAYNKF